MNNECDKKRMGLIKLLKKPNFVMIFNFNSLLIYGSLLFVTFHYVPVDTPDN